MKNIDLLKIVELTHKFFANNGMGKEFNEQLIKFKTELDKARYCAKIIAKNATNFKPRSVDLVKVKSKLKSEVITGLHEYILQNDSYRLQHSRHNRDMAKENKKLIAEIYKISLDTGLIESKRKQKHKERYEQYAKNRVAKMIY